MSKHRVVNVGDVYTLRLKVESPGSLHVCTGGVTASSMRISLQLQNAGMTGEHARERREDTPLGLGADERTTVIGAQPREFSTSSTAKQPSS